MVIRFTGGFFRTAGSVPTKKCCGRRARSTIDNLHPTSRTISGVRVRAPQPVKGKFPKIAISTQSTPKLLAFAGFHPVSLLFHTHLFHPFTNNLSRPQRPMNRPQTNPSPKSSHNTNSLKIIINLCPGYLCPR